MRRDVKPHLQHVRYFDALTHHAGAKNRLAVDGYPDINVGRTIGIFEQKAEWAYRIEGEALQVDVRWRAVNERQS